MSFAHSRNVIVFLKARILRIFPALWAVVLLNAFLLAPIVTTVSIAHYFSDAHVYYYVYENFRLHSIDNLPGVFTHNPFANAVDGSLWTLDYEFKCYFVVAILGVLRILRKEVVLGTFIIACVLNFLHIGGHNVEFYQEFSIGMVFYMFRQYIPIRSLYVIVSVVGLVVGWKFYTPVVQSLMLIFGAYIVFHVAFDTKLKLSNAAKYGDLSYGTYIYAFPIQQVIVLIFEHRIPWIVSLLVTIITTLILAFGSWHLVEKRALRLKHATLFKFPPRKRVGVTG